jgi:hypothetical protein
MEKTVTVKRHDRSSVVTFGTGADVLKFIRGLHRAYERYGGRGAQLIVVDSCLEHHGHVQVRPLTAKGTLAELHTEKAKSTAAGE